MASNHRGSLFSDVLFVLSDDESRKMFEQILEHRDELKISDFGTRKKYYTRLNALKNASLVRKIGVNGRCKPTVFGRIVSEVLRTTQIACNLAWKLKAIEQMVVADIPRDEVVQVIQALVPDKEIQMMLIKEE